MARPIKKLERVPYQDNENRPVYFSSLHKIKPACDAEKKIHFVAEIEQQQVFRGWAAQSQGRNRRVDSISFTEVGEIKVIKLEELGYHVKWSEWKLAHPRWYIYPY